MGQRLGGGALPALRAACAPIGLRRRQAPARRLADLPPAVLGRAPRTAPGDRGGGGSREGSGAVGPQGCPWSGTAQPHTGRDRNGSSRPGRAAAARAERNRTGRSGREHGPAPAEPDVTAAQRHGPCRVRPAAPAAQVDRRHRTGRVRGVLCFSRNAALGQFKDRPDAIRRAAAYVEGIAWKPTLAAPGVCRLPS
ncbi:endonuclease domain-containing protein [Streptomyces prasinopilosus]|uniref:endonuclease domain-containing protein n=1 Tax=Streptomyces prasinopilosus TaxID=67344 RepID=UPI0031400BC8